MSNSSSLLCFRSSVVRSSALCGTASFLLAPAGVAFAADMASAEVERVVVSANRIEQPLSRIGDSVTVIEPDEVRSSQKTAVSDLLATTPGVSVSRNGGFGSLTALRIRGAESDHTVVLLDGVKLNDPSSTGGGFNFGNLLTSDFARIEVLRGPQSTLWGSQAMGGVVNVVTSVPEGPLTGAFAAEGGAQDTAFLHARVEAGGERVAWRVASNYLTTGGISAFDEDLGGAEKDGYRNVGVNVRGIVKITDAVSAELRSVWSKGRVEFDGFRFVPPTFALTDTKEYGYTEELLSYAGINADTFGGRLKHRFGFAYTDTDRENYDPESTVPLTFDATGRNERWEYQGTLALSESINAVFGLESERSKFTTASPSPFEPNPTPLAHDARLDSAYGQLSVSPIEAVTLTAGLRYDDHDTFGDETTGRASLAWSATPTTIVRASYGEGFKAPTLYQLFSDYGNESLAPEQAEGWDAGVEQRVLGDALVVTATYFSTDTTNMIDFVSCFMSSDPRCPARPDGYYDNVQKITADGVELGLVAHLGERLQVSANYTHLDAKNDVSGGTNFGRALARRPEDIANADVTYSWPFGLTTTVAVTHAGKSFDNASNTIKLDGYTQIDFRAALTIRDKFEVFARLENAFDEDHATAANYGSTGRGAFVGVRQSF